MNYPNQHGGHDRPRRPSFFLLFMLGAMALFLYSQYQESNQQAAIKEITSPDISTDGILAGTPGGIGDDWREPRASVDEHQDDKGVVDPVRNSQPR